MMNSHRAWKTFAAGAVGLALCVAAVPAAPKEDIVLTLRDKVIKNLSSSGLVLAFHIGVINQTSTPRQLVRYRYRVRIDQKEYINTEVALDTPLAVPPDG